jgi:hypothetical protein
MRTTRREWLLSVGSMLAWLLPANCGGKEKEGARPRVPGSRNGGSMPDFNRVVTGDHSSNECTPPIPEGFTGLRIDAPQALVFGKDRFVICGTYRFQAEYVYRFPEIHYAVVLVAVDARTHRPLACNLFPPTSPPEIDAGSHRQDPDWMANHFIQRYFNVDLLRFMTELPRTTADYWIYALIEDHVSNVVRVSCKA